MDMASFSGCAGWFDVHFRGSRGSPDTQEIELTTAPSVDNGTHWGQQLSKQLKWLKCLLSSTRNEVMTTVLKDFETKLQIQITCLCETEALGKGRSLAFAKEKLMDGGPFFVLNSNVICEYPLESLIYFHKSHNGEASIIIHPRI
ncbi:hypothetical protein Syun_010776 [Stephania yunnanensis]|uniref:Nucleotidyl transferase domain-containing protein n=1 Tax=Stephania yunnanensis TaxID=152371 RepID=A0AAP0PQ97_9MAGN